MLALVPGGENGLLREQVAFHLAAGADVVLVADPGDDSGLAAALEPHAGSGRARAVPVSGSVQSALAQLGRLAVGELDAEWVIPAHPGEFWWPRGESLPDVLAPMPDRYGIVQALDRPFVASGGEGPLWERCTARRSLLQVPPDSGTPASTMLRPAFRAHPGLDLARPDGGPGTRQPLRAWYPVEVLRLPVAGQTAAEEDIEQGLADGTLVVDERLRDALRAIEAGTAPAFRVPDVVDDASYAGECAAVGEVDLEGLDRQIRALEQRIVELEQGFWPRVQRRASGLLRRSRS